jgi:hypothetical protein
MRFALLAVNLVAGRDGESARWKIPQHQKCKRVRAMRARSDVCVYVYKRVIPLFTTCLFAQGNKL